jgi:hypothetical protein
MLRQPGSPVASNGLTIVFASQRISGNETILTSGSFEVQHRYLGPPNPNNPTADIRIDVAVVDDNNGSVTDFIEVPNPGIQTINVAIDTTPDVPRLELAPPPVMPVFIDQSNVFTQALQQTDVRVASSELTAATDRYFELEVIAPDGEVVSRHRIDDEALNDLRAFFATLPDNQYRIWLVRTDNNSRRLIMDVYVRRGRVIDPSDDSEGTRDRPPTSEKPIEATPLPPEGNPFLIPDPDDPDEPPGASENSGGEEPPVGDRMPVSGDHPADVGRCQVSEEAMAESEPPTLIPLRGSSRWAVPLAGLVLTTGRRSWSEQVRAALEQADDRHWQRLRRAGRIVRRSNQR